MIQNGFNSRNGVRHRPRGGDLFLFCNNEKLKHSESFCPSGHAGLTSNVKRWHVRLPSFFIKEQTVTVYNCSNSSLRLKSFRVLFLHGCCFDPALESIVNLEEYILICCMVLLLAIAA